jgi:hypothetical protein
LITTIIQAHEFEVTFITISMRCMQLTTNAKPLQVCV